MEKETKKKNSKRTLVRGGIAGLALLFLGIGAKTENDRQLDLLNKIKVQKIILDDIQDTLDDEFNELKDTLNDKSKNGLTKEDLDNISKTIDELNSSKESEKDEDDKYDSIIASNSSDTQSSDYSQDSYYNNNNTNGDSHYNNSSDKNSNNNDLNNNNNNNNNSNNNNNNNNNQGSKPEDSSKPGDKDPEKPGDKDPENPGDKDPEKPGDKDPEKPEHEHKLNEVITTYKYKGKNSEGKAIHTIIAHDECTDPDCNYVGEDYTREAECNVNVVTDDIGKTASCLDGCGYTELVHRHTTVTTNTPVLGNSDICYNSSLDCTDSTCDYHKDLGGQEHTFTDVVDYDDWSNPTQEQRECSHVHDNGTKCTATKWFDYQPTTIQSYSEEEVKEPVVSTPSVEEVQGTPEVNTAVEMLVTPANINQPVESSILMETSAEEDEEENVLDTNSEQLDTLVALRQSLINSLEKETIETAKTYIKQQRC